MHANIITTITIAIVIITTVTIATITLVIVFINIIMTLILSLRGAVAFNKDLSNWDVSKVKNMDSMFYEATRL